MKIRVLHGPNLNLLGTREPEIYGSYTLADIEARLTKAAEPDFSIACDQSNHEGQLIDWVHEASDAASPQAAAGLLFNFGALTHTSIALGDALRASPIPSVEVHLSNIHAREPFRHNTCTGGQALGVITGFGPRSYTLGLRALMDYLTDAAF